MAKNVIFEDSDRVPLVVPEGVLSGAPVRVDGLNGVALSDRADTTVAPFLEDGRLNPAYSYGGGNAHGRATVKTGGRAEFVVSFAASVGDEVFIDEDLVLTDDPEGADLFGRAESAKDAGLGPLLVRIVNGLV